MRIGIIYAMNHEGELILNNLENKKEEYYLDLKFTIANYNDNEIIITKSGIGKVNGAITATILISKYNCDLLINTGIAGGSKNLKTRDVALIKEATYSDFDLCNYGYKFGTVPGNPDYLKTDENTNQGIMQILREENIDYKYVTLLSADSFRNSESEINTDIINGDFACDMEGTAIIHTCNKLNKKSAVIRFISDILDSENHLENYDKFELEASEESAKITLMVLKKIKG